MSNKKILVSIGSAFLIVLLFLIQPIPVIEVAGGEVKYFIKEDEFVLGWIHSIEKEEWYETYKRNGETIDLIDTYFKTFGAGTPYEVKETTTENGYIHMDLNMTYNYLNLTISENVKTTLFIDERKIPLYNYFDQYETVLIQTRNISIWNYIWGDFL